jgi:hypothetical protein
LFQSEALRRARRGALSLWAKDLQVVASRSTDREIVVGTRPIWDDFCQDLNSLRSSHARASGCAVGWVAGD